MKPIIAALELATELEEMGFHTAVLRSRGHERYPCVLVSSGPKRRVHGMVTVYTAQDDDGLYYFWTEELEPIAPAEYVETAAEIISAQVGLQTRRIYRVWAILPAY